MFAPMEQGRKNIILYIYIELTQISKKLSQFKKYIYAGKCFPTHKTLWGLSVKYLNHDFQFSKLSMKTDLENELMVAKFILASPLTTGKYS